MQTRKGRLLRPVQSRASRRYRAPHLPPGCDLWAQIGGAIRDLNAGTIDVDALNAIVRECLLRSAELTVAREISLPDAERINLLGAFALRQAQRIARVTTDPPGDPVTHAATPERVA